MLIFLQKDNILLEKVLTEKNRFGIFDMRFEKEEFHFIKNY